MHDSIGLPSGIPPPPTTFPRDSPLAARIAQLQRTHHLATAMSFPIYVKSIVKYKSPHQQDLSFPKGHTLRVWGYANRETPTTEPAATEESDEDDEDDHWYMGEWLDGSRKGQFPASLVVRVEAPESEAHRAVSISSDTTPLEPKAPVASVLPSASTNSSANLELENPTTYSDPISISRSSNLARPHGSSESDTSASVAQHVTGSIPNADLTSSTMLAPTCLPSSTNNHASMLTSETLCTHSSPEPATAAPGPVSVSDPHPVPEPMELAQGSLPSSESPKATCTRPVTSEMNAGREDSLSQKSEPVTEHVSVPPTHTAPASVGLMPEEVLPEHEARNIPSAEAIPVPPSETELSRPQPISKATHESTSARSEHSTSESIRKPPVELDESQKNSSIVLPSTEDPPTKNKADVSTSSPSPAKDPSSMSLRDRIAAFNKPAVKTPPPILRAKPGAWKRPPPAEGEPKPLLPPQMPIASAKTPSPVSSESIRNSGDTHSTPEKIDAKSTEISANGFSASDAKSSIKMSLKERMAALQRNESVVNHQVSSTERKPPVSKLVNPLATEGPPPAENEDEAARRAAIARRMAALGGRRVETGLFGHAPTQKDNSAQVSQQDLEAAATDASHEPKPLPATNPDLDVPPPAAAGSDSGPQTLVISRRTPAPRTRRTKPAEAKDDSKDVLGNAASCASRNVPSDSIMGTPEESKIEEPFHPPTNVQTGASSDSPVNPLNSPVPTPPLKTPTDVTKNVSLNDSANARNEMTSYEPESVQDEMVHQSGFMHIDKESPTTASAQPVTLDSRNEGQERMHATHTDNESDEGGHLRYNPPTTFHHVSQALPDQNAPAPESGGHHMPSSDVISTVEPVELDPVFHDTQAVQHDVRLPNDSAEELMKSYSKPVLAPYQKHDVTLPRSQSFESVHPVHEPERKSSAQSHYAAEYNSANRDQYNNVMSMEHSSKLQNCEDSPPHVRGKTTSGQQETPKATDTVDQIGTAISTMGIDDGRAVDDADFSDQQALLEHLLQNPSSNETPTMTAGILPPDSATTPTSEPAPPPSHIHALVPPPTHVPPHSQSPAPIRTSTDVVSPTSNSLQYVDADLSPTHEPELLTSMEVETSRRGSIVSRLARMGSRPAVGMEQPFVMGMPMPMRRKSKDTSPLSPRSPRIETDDQAKKAATSIETQTPETYVSTNETSFLSPEMQRASALRPEGAVTSGIITDADAESGSDQAIHPLSPPTRMAPLPPTSNRVAESDPLTPVETADLTSIPHKPTRAPPRAPPRPPNAL